MKDFALSDESRNPCAVFMSFIRSRAVKSDRGSSGPSTWAPGHGTAPRTGNDDIDVFMSRWSLDTQALEVLTSLDSTTQQRVMDGFEVPANVRTTPSRIFMGFVKSVTGKGKDKGTGKGSG